MTTREDLQSLRSLLAIYYRGHPARCQRLDAWVRQAIEAAAEPTLFVFRPAGADGWQLGVPGRSDYFKPRRPLRFLSVAHAAIQCGGAFISFSDVHELAPGSVGGTALCGARASAVAWVASRPGCAPLASAIKRVRVTKLGLQYEAAADGVRFIV